MSQITDWNVNNFAFVVSVDDKLGTDFTVAVYKQGTKNF